MYCIIVTGTLISGAGPPKDAVTLWRLQLQPLKDQTNSILKMLNIYLDWSWALKKGILGYTFCRKIVINIIEHKSAQKYNCSELQKEH